MADRLETFIAENKGRLTNGIGEDPEKAIKELRNAEEAGEEVVPYYSGHGSLRGFFIRRKETPKDK